MYRIHTQFQSFLLHCLVADDTLAGRYAVICLPIYMLMLPLWLS